MFRIELEQLNDLILEYESQLEMLDRMQADLISISGHLIVSWEGASKEQFSINSEETGQRLVHFYLRMKKMKNILKKTAQPEVNRELNRCEGFADALTMYGPPEPGESHEPVGTLYLDDSYTGGIADKSAGIGYENTRREQTLWDNAMDCIGGGWFGRRGLKFVSLNLSGLDQEFRRYSKEQGDFILQFNESFFHYQQNIDSLEDRLSAEFGTIMDIQTAEITGRIYEPLIAADRSVNMDRLGYLMTLEPGALSDADYQDLIRVYEVLSVDSRAEDIKKFIDTMYIPHFKKIGGGKYQVCYTVSPVAKELSRRYREYINGLGEVNLSALDIRELRAQLLEYSCSELGEITGGIVEDNRPKGVFGEAKRDIQEMWRDLDGKIRKALDGELGSQFAEIYETIIMVPLRPRVEVAKVLFGQERADAIEQFQENWHEFNHGMIVGEYFWVSDMITGIAGLPDTMETFIIASREKGILTVIGDLVVGFIECVERSGEEFIQGDAKTKGKVIGRLIPDLVLAVLGAVEGAEAAGAVKAAKAETGAAVKIGAEAVDDLGDAGKFASTVEGVVADKIDDVAGSVVKSGGGAVDDILELPDIQIHRSVGAKAKNYDILSPEGDILHLTEGSRITKVNVIAGNGCDRSIDMVDVLVEKYGGNPANWQKCKGFGYVDLDGESVLVELHWYQEPTAGKVDFKIKAQPGGAWFSYDD